MPTFIKPDNWKKSATGFKNWLNLDLLIKNIIKSLPSIGGLINTTTGNDTTEAITIKNTTISQSTENDIFIQTAFPDGTYSLFGTLSNQSGYQKGFVYSPDGNSAFILSKKEQGIFTNVFVPEIDTTYGSIYENKLTLEVNAVFTLYADLPTIGFVGVKYILDDGRQYNWINGVYVELKEVNLQLGKITITDLQQQGFSDLTTARVFCDVYYVGDFLTDVTDESFNNGVYKFTIPENSSFAGDSNFCGNEQSPILNEILFEDPFGLVIVFANSAFSGNNKNNILGNCSFGNNAFVGANPSIKNTIKSIASCGEYFANNYTGRMDIYKFGTGLPLDMLVTNNLCLVVTDYANKFINGGNPDLSIVNIIANLANGNLNSRVSYDGVDNFFPIGVENPTNVVLNTIELNNEYSNAQTGFRVYCSSIIVGAMTYEKTPTGWLEFNCMIP